MHDKRFPLLRRELSQRARDVQSQFAPVDKRRRTICATQQRLGIIESHVPAAWLFQVIETTIAERPKQPGAKVMPIAAVLQIRVRANECVLHHVRCSIVVKHHGHGVSIERALVSFDDDGVLIGITGQNARDDVGIKATVLTDRIARVSHQLTINTAT
jgi:hypothetical protein